MVSTGDTEIILHIRTSRELQSKVPRSAQISFFWGGRVLQTNSNQKCQDVAKFPFFGVGGYSRPTQIKSAKMWPNFYFSGGGVLQTNIPEILEWRHSRNFEHKFISLELATISQTTYMETVWMCQKLIQESWMLHCIATEMKFLSSARKISFRHSLCTGTSVKNGFFNEIREFWLLRLWPMSDSVLIKNKNCNPSISGVILYRIS